MLQKSKFYQLRYYYQPENKVMEVEVEIKENTSRESCKASPQESIINETLKSDPPLEDKYIIINLLDKKSTSKGKIIKFSKKKKFDKSSQKKRKNILTPIDDKDPEKLVFILLDKDLKFVMT